MKLRLRFLFGLLLGLFTLSTQAQTLSPAGITVNPSSARPGDSVTVVITVNNSAAVQFGPGQDADFTVVFTNIATGATFTVTQDAVGPTSGLIGAATQDPQSGQTTPGTGTFTLATTLDAFGTDLVDGELQAGNYSAVITLEAVSVGNIGTTSFSVPTSVLTVTGQPDLQITGLTYAAGTSYVGGDRIAMALTYRNNSSTNGVPNVPYTPGINGFPDFVRIRVTLSSNPTFGDPDDFQLTIQDIDGAAIDDGAPTVDNVGNTAVMADGSAHTFSWDQILPGNFTGSYYVMAKVDLLDALPENDPPALTVNGNNIWGGNALNPAGTLINLVPSNFPTAYLASHATGSPNSATGYSDNPSMTADGRYVAYASDATNLVTGDTNGARDIFFFDSQTSLVHRLSLSQQGAQANGASNNPAISSANGRYVAFESLANNLVVGDTNGFSDIFVVNTLNGLITRISGINASGGQANNPSFKPAISETGRYIVFQSTATNLVPGLTVAPGVSHVYVHNRDVSNSGVFDTPGNTWTRLVDVDVAAPSSGVGNADAIQATISANGSWVAFASKATNLVAPATTAARQHVYARQVANVGTGTSGIKLISVVTTTAAEGNSHSQTPSLSADGHYVAFASLATNLVAGDTNAVSDVFVYDNTAAVATPVVVRMSVSTAGAEGTDPSPTGPPDQRLGSLNPTISADGRYVAFSSLCDDLTDGDVNGQYQGTDSNAGLDIFVHDRQVSGSGAFDAPGNIATTMVSRNPFGYQTSGLLGVPSTPASNIYPVISANGRYVAFPSDAESTAGLAFGATNLLPVDSNGLRDIFLHDRRTNAGVTPPTPPTVTITSPGSGTSVLVNTPVAVSASATTSIGVVSSVQFFVNGTSLGTSSVFPYSQTWTPPAVGTFTLSALVTDSFGNIGVSSNVTVTVNASPSVGITSPVAGTSIVVGTDVIIAATAAASNPGATITQVQFFANGVSLGDADTSSPYQVTWSPASTGTFTLTAAATDSVGTTQTSPDVNVTVITTGGGGGATPPTVALSPAPPATTPVNVPVTLTANALAASGYILDGVTYYENGVEIGSANAYPYAVEWTPRDLGTHTITAVAVDNIGTTATSTGAEVSVVAGIAPAIVLTSPVAGSLYAEGSSITVAARAALGDSLVTSVQFLANGVSIGSASSAPFKVAFTPNALGSYSFKAVAIDSAGNRYTSSPVTVTVRLNTPPTISLSSPTNAASYALGTGVLIAASASDTDGQVVGVQLLANGLSLASLDAPPYTFSWLPQTAGTYEIKAIATDNSDDITTSSARTITLTAQPAAVVSISNPAAGVSYPVGNEVPFVATVTGGNGPTKQVQFYVNGSLLTSDSTAPYSATWNPGAPGTYSLMAVATDSVNVSASSAIRTVTITGNAAPTVSLTSPSAGATFNAGAPVTLVATAADVDGTIASVRFLANGNSVGLASAAPFVGTWTPTAPGIYVLSAQAIDNSGNLTNSSPVSVAIAANASPTVTLTSPLNGATLRVSSNTTVSAVAADPDGIISSVQFYANGVPIGSGTTPPYRIQWSPTAEGLYRLMATAIDNAGAVTTSATVLIVSSLNAGDSVSMGTYQGTGEIGNFGVAAALGSKAAFLGYSKTAGVRRIYAYDNLAVDVSGGYRLMNDAGHSIVAGTVSETGTSGTLDGGRLTFIGVDTRLFPTATPIPAGYYTGRLTGQSASTVSIIIGADGSVVLHVKNGTFEDAAGGGIAEKLDSTGAFSLGTMLGSRVTGRVDLSTSLISGTLSGQGGGEFTAAPSVLGAAAASKIIGLGTEVLSNVTLASNGYTYDQVLLQGPTASISADPGQITRISFLDLSNDIVQVEFSGAGRLSVTLDNASGPELATQYNQPTIRYMKGHARLVITGADETTNVAVFSVGRITAVNQGLFKAGVTYDGVADLAYVAVLSANGRFGGLRTGNANYSAAAGMAGVCAPDVQFVGPVYVGDITTSDSANPVLQLGSATDVRITGGDLWQANGKPVQVSGFDQLRFVDGTSSHGVTLRAQVDRSRLEQDGVDVTAQVVVNPDH